MKLWSAEEEAFLKGNYQRMRRQDIAKKLGRSESSVHSRLGRLRIVKEPKWTEEEEKYLFNAYETEPKEEILRVLKRRTWISIIHKGPTLGLSRPRAIPNVTCDNCGKRFHQPPSEVSEHNFCSRECYFEWQVGENNPNWRGGWEKYYGPNWESQRKKALERDAHTCQRCGKTEKMNEHPLDVHHIIPFREFGIENYKEANRLDNLLSLCQSCHPSVEGGKND